MNCRHCSAPLSRFFLDLGHAPPSNAYLKAEDLNAPETYLPLKVMVCERCRLVQTKDCAKADALFDANYAYFSSTSKGWLSHATAYTEMITDRLSLTIDALVIEIASNDGYLLRNFVERGIPCLGIEPTDSTAAVAEAQGIPVLREFFGTELAERLVADRKVADLVCGNNVYAHVPDINDFTLGIAAVLKPEGVVTLEFPHLLRLIEEVQFDTVYHEHFSYLSLQTVSCIFQSAGLRVFDVERLSTHGGSLRVYGCLDGACHTQTEAVQTCLNEEAAGGLNTNVPYDAFQARADTVKNGLLRFLLKAKAEGKSVAAYGAAAKGNTLLNYAGVKPDLLPFVCDAAAAKQGKYLPGSHIPILAPAALQADRPDYVLILPWNLEGEVRSQLGDLAVKGTKFVVAVPEIRIL
jgi:SAM-dependent methyltransferase